MKVRAYAKFRDLYWKLPASIRRKALRQIHRLSDDAIFLRVIGDHDEALRRP